MRLMRGQPHERSPLVSVLSDNRGPCSRSMDVCASDGHLTTNRRTADRFDRVNYTTHNFRKTRG